MAADYLNDTSQFDVARKRVQQQSASNLQTRKDALARRFASLGNLEGGARLKIEQQAENEEAQNAAQANEGVDAAQQAEMGRRREVLQGQQFARGERESGQKFGAEQAAMQRAYLTGEREAGQKFGTGERQAGQLFQGEMLGKQQVFATGEREAGQQFASTERAGAQQFASGESKLGRDQQALQFGESMGLQRDQLAMANQQFIEGIRQFNEALAQQKEETRESIMANKNAGGSNWISSGKKAAASWNPF